MRKRKGPGKSFRRGISLMELIERFDTEEKAEAWFVKERWPDGVTCPFCFSQKVSQVKSRKPQPFRCQLRPCRKYFSVKTGTVMHNSKLSLRKWILAIYAISTHLKGISSMKLHRDIGVTQKTAWHLGHRIRETMTIPVGKMQGEVEVDETFIGGIEMNKHAHKKLHAGRGAVGKATVVGIKERNSGWIHTEVVDSRDKGTIQGFVLRNTEKDAIVYSDEAKAYEGIPRHHESVKHSAGEYAVGAVTTNGMESHWSLFKRGYVGTYHHMSEKHLQRYVNEFAGRHNYRVFDTEDQMGFLVFNANGRRLSYEDLIGQPHTRQPRML